MSMRQVYRPQKSADLTVGATTSGPSTAISNGIQVVRLVASTDMRIALGPSVSGATTPIVFLPALSPEYFLCEPGDLFVAKTEDGSSGAVLNITEVTR